MKPHKSDEWMSFRSAIILTLGIVCGAVQTLPAPKAEYQLVNIVDDSGPFDANDFGSASINNNGVVAFKDGRVNAADYTTWRNRLNTTAALSNDDTVGVGTDDFTRWKNNFGAGSAGSRAGRGAAATGSASVAVPESATIVLLSLAAFGLLQFRVTAFITREIPSRH